MQKIEQLSSWGLSESPNLYKIHKKSKTEREPPLKRLVWSWRFPPLWLCAFVPMQGVCLGLNTAGCGVSAGPALLLLPPLPRPSCCLPSLPLWTCTATASRCPLLGTYLLFLFAWGGAFWGLSPPTGRKADPQLLTEWLWVNVTSQHDSELSSHVPAHWSEVTMVLLTLMPCAMARDCPQSPRGCSVPQTTSSLFQWVKTVLLLGTAGPWRL